MTTGISGSLEDVSVAEVFQFVHLGRRTGTLILGRGDDKALIGFHEGRLISATAPKTPRFGELLVATSLLSQPELTAALELQAIGAGRRSLGQILLDTGLITPEALRRVIAEQIQQAVAEVLTWEAGTFEFAVDDLLPADDIALYPSEVLPETQVNTQMVLLEATRVLEERSRTAAARTPPVAGARATQRPGGPPIPGLLFTAREMQEALAFLQDRVTRPQATLELQLVTGDDALAARLEELLAGRFARIERLHISRAGETAANAQPPVVVVDVRPGGARPELLSALHHARPRASIIALVEPGSDFARVYGAGVTAAVPAQAESVAACIGNVLEARKDLQRLRASDETDAALARLRRVIGELRSGLLSASLALNLMHVISESVERAVLLHVKEGQLVALGAFGSGEGGRHLAELTRGLRLPVHGAGMLARVFEGKEMLSLAFEDAGLPRPLAAALGRARNGQVVAFPVLAGDRVISVILADNGEREEPVADLALLELVTAQVGMAFELERLRRQAGDG